MGNELDERSPGAVNVQSWSLVSGSGHRERRRGRHLSGPADEGDQPGARARWNRDHQLLGRLRHDGSLDAADELSTGRITVDVDRAHLGEIGPRDSQVGTNGSAL